MVTGIVVPVALLDHAAYHCGLEQSFSQETTLATAAAGAGIDRVSEKCRSIKRRYTFVLFLPYMVVITTKKQRGQQANCPGTNLIQCVDRMCNAVFVSL